MGQVAESELRTGPAESRVASLARRIRSWLPVPRASRDGAYLERGWVIANHKLVSFHAAFISSILSLPAVQLAELAEKGQNIKSRRAAVHVLAAAHGSVHLAGRSVPVVAHRHRHPRDGPLPDGREADGFEQGLPGEGGCGSQGRRRQVRLLRPDAPADSVGQVLRRQERERQLCPRRPVQPGRRGGGSRLERVAGDRFACRSRHRADRSWDCHQDVDFLDLRRPLLPGPRLRRPAGPVPGRPRQAQGVPHPREDRRRAGGSRGSGGLEGELAARKLRLSRRSC